MGREDVGSDAAERAVAVVGISALLPDAPDAKAFWQNVITGKNSIREVPTDRWDPADYWNPDPAAPDKTYCKIGAFVRGFTFDSLKFRIPPRIAAAMDPTQQWMLCCARDALLDAGHPDKGTIDPSRVAVILGNALGGELHERTAMRVLLPEAAHGLQEVPEFQALPESVRSALLSGMLARTAARLPPVTEDSMPGELANVIAGRVTNVLDLCGMNFTADAACASSLAALQAAMGVLASGQADAVLTGGVDRSMSAVTYVKFAKIGALSPDGSRPFDAAANGFIMGEGCIAMVLKRLADAEKAGDRIYAVIRAVGGSSDGKGKGITAPNPHGQILAIRRAYEQAGFSPKTVGLIEAHGTSTKVGDAAEAESLAKAFADSGLPRRSVAIGSVKSQIGHLKSGAGAAGLLKAVLALHHKVLPPSINVRELNPAVPWDNVPFYVNTQTQPWEGRPDAPRRAGVSSFGFGGTNFHVVVEEHIPGLLTRSTKPHVTVSDNLIRPTPQGMLCFGAPDAASLKARLGATLAEARAGRVPRTDSSVALATSNERVTLLASGTTEIVDKVEKALGALDTNDPRVWKALRLKGVVHGSGPAPKAAFLFPGQGSQYVGMLAKLRETEPVVRDTFAEADEAMAGKLPKRLTEYIFDSGDAEKADLALRDTQVCQPAMLAADLALLRLLKSYGIEPDMAIGHSLGEYAALVATGALPFEDALLAVSARAKEMANVSIADKGRMASIFGPEDKVREVLARLDGYVVAANINSRNQTVIGGATDAMERAVQQFQALGFKAIFLPVSHAFHTEIVSPASRPLRQMLSRLRLDVPKLPLISNVTGEPYPTGEGAREKMLDLLAKQVAAPVQFVRGLETLYRMGARVFVEIGPKKVLASFAEDIFADTRDAVAFCAIQPKRGDIESFTEALAGMVAAGLARRREPLASSPTYEVTMSSNSKNPAGALAVGAVSPSNGDAGYHELGRVFASFLETGLQTYTKHFGNNVSSLAARPTPAVAAAPAVAAPTAQPAPRPDGSIVVTGVALGLPGQNHALFSDDNIDRILAGESFIEPIPLEMQKRMLAKRVVRLVKGADGSGKFETISSTDEVLKLAGRGGPFDLVAEYGIAPERAEAYDAVTSMAVAAGLGALRDAGIPLVRRYKQTTKGTMLPDRWVLPESMADETGVILASAFPSFPSMLDEAARYYEDRVRRERLAELKGLRASVTKKAQAEVDARIHALEEEIEKDAYTFNRKFLFRALSMGHSQFAELIGARGPNTQVNGACASAGQALGLADDWIRYGRCRRVVVITADDVTNDRMLEWFGTGFLASGAASTEADVTKAALPFDRRRHGLIVGMGASGLVLEAEDAVRERGMRGIAEVLGVEVSNSAFHGSRLDVQHISEVMERLVSRVENRRNLDRKAIAANTVFVSHETYTPARGGSASAEIHSLRRVFGDRASQVVIANTKGMTGHAMGAGVEEAVAVKILEKGIVPPVPNLKEPDPELGDLMLSKGGRYPVSYALRLGAGFGSQIVIALMQKVKGERVADAAAYQRWLSEQSGRPHAQVEVDHKTLRVKDEGAPTLAQAKSTWSFGMAPALRAEVDGVPGAQRSAPPRAIAQAEAKPLLAAAPAPVTAAPAIDAVADRVLGLVSAKTGYPRDMLALDLDLEADLGIDTVKQAEIFGEIREAFQLPRRDDLKLRDYPTLNHLIGFVKQLRPDLAQASAAAPTPVPAPAAIPAPVQPVAAPTNAVADKLLGVVAAKTGYPRDMLALDLDLEADLGIDTVKQAEIFAEVRTAFELPRRDDMRLRDYPTLGHIIKLVTELRPDLAATALPAVATAAPAAAAAPATVSDPVSDKLLEIVAAKTGYPRDMLALDLDLEADLGIDTVKQAEIFAEVRTAFELPRRDDMKLRDYPTLGHIIKLVAELRPDLAAAALPTVAPAAPPAAAPAPAAASNPVSDKLLEVVAAKTGYPRDMLALDLDLEADLGIDTVKQAEIFAEIRSTFELPRQDDMKLRDYPTLGHIIKLVCSLRPELAPVAGPAPVAAPPPSAAPVADKVTDTLLEVVAAKTGYPRDMLALDLDLEADLGIDTVKQAEIFGEIRQAFGLPRRDDLKLRDYPTLNHLIALVRQATGATQAAPAQTPSAAAAPAQTSSSTPTAAVRRVPVPVLRPELALCRPTGAELGEGKRVVLVADHEGFAAPLAALLHGKGVETLVLEAGSVEDQAKAWLDAGPIAGVFVLSGLDAEPDVTVATHDELQVLLDERVRRVSRLARALLPALSRKGAFFVAATRMGGLHGYGQAPTAQPLSGAVCGFTKALSRECPELVAKVVDMPADTEPHILAQSLIAEALRDPGVVEAGYAFGTRHGIGLSVTDWPTQQPMKLNADQVFLVTGAAGGITSAIVRDLATASRGTFWLLDLAPLPNANNPDLARMNDRDGLRRDLFERLKKEKAGERVTPAQVEKIIAGLERDAAVLSAIRGVEEAGGRVQYRAVDVRDPKAMAAIVEEIRTTHGRIDVLLHAAGIEKSRMLADKPQDEFDRVFDVKVLGLCNLLRAAQGMPIGAMVAFSSVAGRFGNGGQTDYSAANDFLCKMMLGIARTRPETRGLAIDWTAWGGMGMATRGSIPEMMKRAGIDMLDPAEGVPVIRHELEAGSRGEFVAGGALGILVAPKDADGGLDLDAVATRLSAEKLPMVGRVLSMDLYGGLAIETVLDPTLEPFLRDHEIDGVPVLPGVMGLEGFAEVARLLVPDHRVSTIESVRFEQPMKYYRRQPRPGLFRAQLRREGSESIVAEITLSSSRSLATGEKAESRHFSGHVRLTRSAPEPVMTQVLAPNGHRPVPKDAIYRIYFHGPSYRVLDQVELCDHSVRSRLRNDLPPALATEAAMVIAPRAIEMVLQAAGVYEIAKTGRLALPAAIDRILTHATPGENAELHAEVTPRIEDGMLTFDAKVLDSLGTVYFELIGYRTSAMPTGLPDELLQPLRQAVTGAEA